MQGFVKKDGETMEMKSTEEKDQPEGTKECKEPSKDSPYRWTAFAIYTFFSVTFLLAVIIMVAFP